VYILWCQFRINSFRISPMGSPPQDPRTYHCATIASSYLACSNTWRMFAILKVIWSAYFVFCTFAAGIRHPAGIQCVQGRRKRRNARPGEGEEEKTGIYDTSICFISVITYNRYIYSTITRSQKAHAECRWLCQPSTSAADGSSFVPLSFSSSPS